MDGWRDEGVYADAGIVAPEPKKPKKERVLKLEVEPLGGVKRRKTND
jgi:hypothetical protein